ncbi:heparan-alpha-glucosaminide N-acetyltransferase domain-containing protein [uncultured Gulosibacter sp.]|uniref:heparan-alpha-glucosaminide N-acetyltransferase domain-containing protein n=1 Tax=uncultured Gulosibacter sp. TaxID=1339167 RepID=UPI00288B0F9F|nr:heparan-alpha-glucosaminide N-acetyltransferase domain-containing protein [uncultured Gulosibacter sp.]
MQKIRSLIDPPRITGLDLARALAIIGMIFAHMALVPPLELAKPETWPGIIHGFTSLLFAFLAGVSVALMTGGTARPAAEKLPTIRLRFVGRGAVIFAIGLILESLGTPIAIILPIFGLLYIAMLPFISMRPRYLIIWGAAIMVFAPMLVQLLQLSAPYASALAFVFYGNYPLHAWLAMALFGMALGRFDLRSRKLASIAVLVGIAITTIGFALASLIPGGAGQPADEVIYSVSSSSWSVDGDYLPDDDFEFTPLADMLTGLTNSQPHTGGGLEIFLGVGVSLAVAGLCLLIGSTRMRWVTLPLAALGSMPLTVYSLHVAIYVAVYGNTNLSDWVGPVEGDPTALIVTLAFLVGCTAWALTVGRGPLESLMRTAGLAASGELRAR